MNVEAMPIMKGLNDKDELQPTTSRGGVRVRMMPEQISEFAAQHRAVSKAQKEQGRARFDKPGRESISSCQWQPRGFPAPTEHQHNQRNKNGTDIRSRTSAPQP
jgi:hypothetical protein